MQDESNFKESFEKGTFSEKEKGAKVPEEEEKRTEKEEKVVESVEERKKERVVPTLETLKSAATAPPPTPREDLSEEEEKEINSLVSLTIKNPNLEKGLDEANKRLNARIRKLKKEGKDFAYLIDEFHDKLVLKLQERERKFKD